MYMGFLSGWAFEAAGWVAVLHSPLAGWARWLATSLACYLDFSLP
jgi:hypothetical protein